MSEASHVCSVLCTFGIYVLVMWIFPFDVDVILLGVGHWVWVWAGPELPDFCYPLLFGACHLAIIYPLVNLEYAAEAVILGFQHYIVMLGTSVIIPSALVPQMGGGNVSIFESSENTTPPCSESEHVKSTELLLRHCLSARRRRLG